MHRLIVPLLVLFPASTVADQPCATTDLSGNWRHGSWTSDGSGHSGTLNARFRKMDDGHYRVVFRGRFFRVLPFRYAVTLNVTGYEDDRVYLAGSKRLPLFGTFHYSAVATPCRFTATYQSGKDSGVFELGR